ncbi:Ig-like domain-containing protein [Citrobacter amalonaticus]|uniref:Ig-like domain-containing protein n=1 Tax=Citrobacter amalonaticus TaxID=35703 RepID=UPI00300D5151
MSKQNMATGSLIFYTGKNYAGTPAQVVHGSTGQLASQTGEWYYQSVATSGMHAFIQSQVNTAVSSTSYLSHVEDIISANISDLSALYPSVQYPMQYLGIDPAIVVPVWLEIDANQTAPNAVAATSLVGASHENITSLALPGRQGVLGFVSLDNGSSVVANCRYGDYSSSDGTVNWNGNGTVTLEYLSGAIQIVSTAGFPADWRFGTPQIQSDGSWKVDLNGGSSSTNVISALTSDKASIVDDGTDTARLTATVINSVNSQPVSGVTVSWTTSLGNLSVASSVTDSNGQAMVLLTDAGQPGTATVIASISGDSESVNIGVGENAGFKMYCTTGAPTTALQPNAVNPVGLHGTPGQSIRVSVSGSAVIYGVNPVVLDQSGYGRLDIANAIAEQVTVTAQTDDAQETGVMYFVPEYAYPVFSYAYQLTQNAPADGKTPNMIYCQSTHGISGWLSLSGNAKFKNGSNSYQFNSATDLAVEVYDYYPETVMLQDSTVTVGNIAFAPVVNATLD